MLVAIALFALSRAPQALAGTSGGCYSAIHWEPCKTASVGLLQFECSNFTVPLDHLDTASNKTITLQATRVPAVKESIGSLFVNFGGPGYATRDSLIGAAEELMVVSGGNYDLIGLDPRGTANNSPFKCYNDTERRTIMQKHRVNDAYGPADKVALARMWASIDNVVKDCVSTTENAPEIGAYIGTGYAARDMMLLNDALNGPDALLNYWGISYGTALGAVTAALFPERVGRVLLSSNVNLPEWFNGYDIAWWSDADNAVLEFFNRCVEAEPGLCALASRKDSADELYAKLFEVIDDLRLNPIPVGQALVLDSSALKMAFRGILYTNQAWPFFAVVLNELYKPAAERDVKILTTIWPPLSQNTDVLGNLQDESLFGIECSDKTIRAASFDEAFAVTEQLANVSKALGEVANNLVYLCAQWPYNAKGGYEGGWNDVIDTANPILFTGSRYDFITPIGNAFNSSRIFAGSGVFTHHGVGHDVSAHPSLCTARTLRDYFQNGTLPAADLNCTADFDAFDTTKTWKDSYLPELGLE
ncbi:hypothetical protein F5X68DRAFT_245129 [Plectosphaerella plurivora]|uniref:Peptidase S33 tripeptidyl aminopeptidase-like C-terminal domain-containing protein n=1 Tax=Plectosphaerella plurivora TaxID=936078 RepID=A0A9P8V6J8_9PEZI|nr:hypothetical protein F5X68DRAFT_245129 [Plectosphaerella plurivora]